MSAHDHPNDVGCCAPRCEKTLPSEDALFFDGLPYCSQACARRDGKKGKPRYSVPLQENTQ